MMDTPENYYATLGVPLYADSDMLKRAYRQLARRFHPDLAGEESAVQMKRINRAYAVLSDPEQRHHYDTIIGGVIDLRKSGFVRPATHPHRPSHSADDEFSGLTIFSTDGPLHAGPVIHNSHDIISTLSHTRTVQGILIAAGSLDGKGQIWQVVDNTIGKATSFASDPTFMVESLRELRFSTAGSLLAGWGRLGLHVWDAYSGDRLWSYPLHERAVSAHYSLDMALQVTPDQKRIARIALPYLPDDIRTPRAWGVRATDVVSHEMGTPENGLFDQLVCTEEVMENRRFWAIRMRALSQDARTLVTLSCGQMPQEKQHMAIVHRWNLAAKRHLGGKTHPHIGTAIVVGLCEDSTPPYAITPDTTVLAFVHQGHKIRLCDTTTGTYSEVASGMMGGNSKIALSPDAQWLAVAREDSEVNEGVIDLWSTTAGQIVQKFYHPWQISALHFADNRMVVALTDGTIQIWQ